MMYMHHPQVGLAGWYRLGFQQILFQRLEVMIAQGEHLHQPTHLLCFHLKFVGKSAIKIFLEGKMVSSTQNDKCQRPSTQKKP